MKNLDGKMMISEMEVGEIDTSLKDFENQN